MARNTRSVALAIIHNVEQQRNVWKKNKHEARLKKMCGAWMQDGRQCVADGIRALRLKRPLTLPVAEGIPLDKYFDRSGYVYQLALPDKNIVWAEHIILNGKDSAGKQMQVKAKTSYILAMYKALGDEVTAIAKDAVSPIIFENPKVGDGLVMPFKMK